MKLLLKKDKTDLKREYIFRFINVSIIFLIILIIIWSVSLIPSFASVLVKQKTLKDQEQQLNALSVVVERDKYKNLAREINALVSSIDTDKQDTSVIIDNIRKQGGNAISIESYQITFSDEGGIIDLKGIATNRAALVDFSKKLETIEGFTNVDVPVSSFTKDVELPFTIEIELVYLTNE